MTATISPRSTSEELDGALVGRTADGLTSIDRTAWNQLLSPGGGALEHGYLTAWEKSELQGLRSCPVVAAAEGSENLLAACPGYLYDLDIVGVRLPAAAHILQPLRRVWPRLLHVRTYELGSPTPLTNPFLVTDERLRAPAVHALIEAGIARAQRARAQFVLVQNFPSLDLPAAQQLQALGFAPVPMLPTAIVDLPYASFDEYLGAMRAQYRRRARQAFKRSSELRIEHLEHFRDHADELARLWRLIYDRAIEVRREILPAGFFAAVSELEESSVLLARRGDGSIAAFALLLADRPWLSFLHCGFDAEAARSEGAYFRLLYEIVRVAIEQGFEQVELGMTTLQPKLDIGGVPIPLYACLRHRHPLVQRALGAVGNRVIQPDQLEPRKVFKDPPPTANELVARRMCAPRDSRQSAPAPDRDSE